ncbi:MAG: YmdB family metallophosphoesterase [bacterium]
MKWLCIGDVVSSPGRSAVRDYLEDHESDYDLIIANGENTSGGTGLTRDNAQDLLRYGVDVITGGNHIWKKSDFVEYLSNNPDELPVIRPANYPGEPPGRGHRIFQLKGFKILVANIQGRTFMESIDCPFQTIDNIIDSIQYDLALVDFHAEATSEKIAMGRHLSGKVTGVVGTHTHVQTADEQILDGGTGYITDLGMTGPKNSILGVRTELATKRFLTGRPIRFKVEKQGPRILNALSITVDEDEHEATRVQRIFEQLPERTY